MRLQLTSLSQVGKAYRKVVSTVHTRSPEAIIEGVPVQPRANPGIEAMAGVTDDRTFGPVAMLGLGGIFAEVMNDVAFRVVPARPRDAPYDSRDPRLPHIAGLPRGVTGRSRCTGR